MTTHRILLAEDDSLLGELIVHMLEKTGFGTVEWVENGEDAYHYCMDSHYDVAVLDWMLPGWTGLSVCKKLRENGYAGAILMLTAKDALCDRVQGLDAGADDYLVKPFELEELQARLRALCRRNYAPLLEEVAELDGLYLNRSSLTLSMEEEVIQLSPREFQMLDLLLRNKSATLSRELILERIWGYDSDVSTKIVDATIKLLRKKLELFNKQHLIHSIRGVGYKLE
ncbi:MULTISPECIES: response regulator transcription factor [unclassified Paenibacillus]|uniref:response regulator transcription factor n=1 Tax=unclassified Paenibacillus TaxID=185978 RepID=UPI00088284FB|nr:MULTISPECIES: response regulator transcription factor [unclassified Paenibacillus]SDK98477.1 transcriptional regulator [Paenibacillus sp. OK060]SLK21294.1 transcriptional regulator [Paenibacillus sp. RU5A]SOC76554.1 transcriptional regulator [Paenibacillus sp. RU26A]SOC78021.1 transcriptional regulator [Paenibacillus sp. RU5M]